MWYFSEYIQFYKHYPVNLRFSKKISLRCLDSRIMAKICGKPPYKIAMKKSVTFKLLFMLMILLFERSSFSVNKLSRQNNHPSPILNNHVLLKLLHKDKSFNGRIPYLDALNANHSNDNQAYVTSSATLSWGSLIRYKHGKRDMRCE